jgi:hypothetical protein
MSAEVRRHPLVIEAAQPLLRLGAALSIEAELLVGQALRDCDRIGAGQVRWRGNAIGPKMLTST